MRRTSKTGATGGRAAAAGRAAYTLTSSAMTGSSRRWGRGARSQRSSFTEELVHGLVDLSLTPLLCRRNSCAVPSAAARPRLDDMATLSTSAGAVSGGAHRGVRETMAFIAQDWLGPEKVRRVDAESERITISDSIGKCMMAVGTSVYSGLRYDYARCILEEHSGFGLRMF